MKIRYLKYLIEVERAGSINKAASSLYISQQGLSKALDSMESELGVKLVERSRAGARLTEAGRGFASHAERILDEYRLALDDLSPVVVSRAHVLDVVVSPYVVMALMGQVVPNLDSAFEASYSEAGNTQIVQRLRSGEEGSLFIFDWLDDDPSGDGVPFGGDVEVGCLLRSRLGAVMRAEGAPEGITRAELCKRPVLSYGRTDYQRMLGRVLGAGEAPRLVGSLSSKELLIDSLLRVERSTAVVDELSFGAGCDIPGCLAFVPLLPQRYLVTGFAYARRATCAPLFQCYLREWQDALASL